MNAAEQEGLSQQLAEPSHEEPNYAADEIHTIGDIVDGVMRLRAGAESR